MNVGTPRMRMFAGPNGSGKTTVQRDIARKFESGFIGVLVNPDDLEATIGVTGRLDLGPFEVSADESGYGQRVGPDTQSGGCVSGPSRCPYPLAYFHNHPPGVSISACNRSPSSAG